MKRLQQILFFILAVACATAPHAQAGVKVTYFHNDATGTPVAASDEAGAVIWRKVFRPFGSELDNGGVIARDNTIGYTGHRFDDDLDLVYAGARYYDPMIGRFLSMDPVGFQEESVHSFNKYTYANNNPYKYIDPDGRDPSLAPIYHVRDRALVRSDPVYAEFSLKADIAVATTVGSLLFGAKEAVQSVFEGVTGIEVPIPSVKKIFKRFAKNTGDLTKAEIKQIQNVVNEAGRPLEVVGSAAKGTRRGVGSDLPVGKGDGTKSDIDVLIPPSSKDHFKGLTDKLPDADVNIGTANPHIGPSIRFEPN